MNKVKQLLATAKEKAGYWFHYHRKEIKMLYRGFSVIAGIVSVFVLMCVWKWFALLVMGLVFLALIVALSMMIGSIWDA